MKTVVITGSARGLGLCMAKKFRQKDFNVIISDIKEEPLIKSYKEMLSIKGKGKVSYCICDVTKTIDISKLINFAISEYKTIDIWINNAGVNQTDKALWELSEKEINLILNVDLKATIISSKLIMEEMIKWHKGAIYNIEGYGSNDAMMLGLNMYGTSKRAITHFTKALAKESEEKNTGVIVGRLSPGIMITDFITTAGNGEKINLPEKTKHVYNILGDYPEVIANFLVDKMINNKKNNIQINWLTNSKAIWRFMTSWFNKRDFFGK